jgi:hypothetical protein
MPGLDWRALALHRGAARGAAFYFSCLEYGQVLWCRGQPARAMLCLDRAMGADLEGDEAVLKEWPMPYEAMASIMKDTPGDVFLGNPRVHFQHYADRMNEPRREQRKWRAWACWALARMVLPELPPDPKHAVIEPSSEQIAEALARHGIADEARLWLRVLAGAGR